MSNLTNVLDEVSYERMLEQHPALVEAIQSELAGGSTPHKVYLAVMAHTHKQELALWAEQVARCLTVK